jgi:16S rRNA (guanine966-N2)-methyltransferase
VIGGELGGRRLRAPAGRATRPSSGRLRQALFDVLGPAIAGRPFLDGFAGSGAVGIEAYSRGARPVVWIEPAREAARALRANLATLALPRDQAVVLERRFAAGLKLAAKLATVAAAGGFGVVFLDPPYAEWRAYPEMLGAVARAGAMPPDGWLILEARRGSEMPAAVAEGAWRRARVHAVGDSVLAMYRAGGAS